jgi:hypothetical protein
MVSEETNGSKNKSEGEPYLSHQMSMLRKRCDHRIDEYLFDDKNNPQELL